MKIDEIATIIMYIHTNTHTHTHIHTSLHLLICKLTEGDMGKPVADPRASTLYVCVCVCIYICTSISFCMCILYSMFIYFHIHKYTHTYTYLGLMLLTAGQGTGFEGATRAAIETWVDVADFTDMYRGGGFFSSFSFLLCASVWEG